jgi:soluble lytic murein transglycosylase
MKNPDKKTITIFYSTGFLAFVLFAAVLALKTIKSSHESKSNNYNHLITNAAARHNVDPTLVKAVIKQESQFHADARGAKKEIGLMQVTPAAVKDWERVQKRRVGSTGAVFEPELNIEIGTWYLGIALKQWRRHPEKEILALVQYNAGRARALKWSEENNGKNILESIPFETTRTYIMNVLQYRSEFNKPEASARVE